MYFIHKPILVISDFLLFYYFTSEFNDMILNNIIDSINISVFNN